MKEQDALRRRIYALSFACWELHLFLDTHPNNGDAARKQEEYQARLDALKKEYEEKYGPIGEMPQNTSRWAWVADPWPWEAAANEACEKEEK